MERPFNKEDEESSTPGPGTYTLPSMESVMSENSDGQILPSASLRSTTERTGWYRPAVENPYKDAYWIHNVPGPGFYNTEKCRSGFPPKVIRRVRSQADALQHRTFLGVHHPQQLLALRDSDALSLCGFGSTSERDILKHEELSATPAAYSTEARSIAASVEARGKVGKKGIFGTTAVRSGVADPLPLGTSEEVGPGHYGSPLPPAKGKLYTGSAFRSQVVRFPDKPDTPFGKYDMDKIPNYRNKFRKPKSEHLSFGSGKNRFNSKEIFIGQTFTLAPGPGDYEPRLEGAKAMSIMYTEDRKLAPSNKEPQGIGPGEYVKHGSLIKKTYNMLSPEEAAQRTKDRDAGLIDVSTLVGGAGGGAAGMRARLALTNSLMRSQSEG